ncbi:MAG: hypothetical protein K6E47_05775 [Lachnospiraceae bacterium]|nr:hypothetical protein [Lachnospiraceae bacterium]
MKRIVYLALCIVFLSLVTGCNSDGIVSRTGNQSSQVEKIIEEAVESEKKDQTIKLSDEVQVPSESDAGLPKITMEAQAVITNEPETVINEQNDTSDMINTNDKEIDIDLTSLSSTMVYSEVYHMMVSPEDYIGKKIKMAGNLGIYHDESQNKNYYACIIQDATACCAQGIEFELTDEYTYPEDYPEDGAYLCVVGIFDTYEEGPYTYCTLRNAVLE